MADHRNVFGEPLEPCCASLMTGFYRTGSCETGPDDRGAHVVCAQVTDDFLAFTRANGNDLSRPVPAFGFPGLKPGDQWCVCAGWWKRALDAGVACFLGKPFEPDDLLECIRSSLTHSNPDHTRSGDSTMPTITTKDGTQIYYKDWGAGQPVVFSHGWPLSSDAWEAQMMLVADNGYRAIGHDRRGHGRSSQPWNGNEMDTYADDLAALIEKLDLKDIVLVGHSTGGGEITRYIGRHGTKRVAKAVLVGAVPPLMLKTTANPGGLPFDVFDGIRAASRTDRGQLYKDLASGPFFGFNRPGAKASQGMIDAFWLQGVTAGHKNTYDCIKAFSETDFTEDLKKFDVPTLILHGDDDQIVPIDAAGRAAAKLVKGSTLKVYPGGAHALMDTDRDKFNADLLAFLKS
jgi:non-heme chloroperoxidase